MATADTVTPFAPVPAASPDAVEPSTSGKDGPSSDPFDAALLKEFYSDLREVDRDNEVTRILNAFKLNPFEQLGLPFDASLEDARRQYRKVSLLVHPDKCSHPRAKEAFEVIGAANIELADDEKRRQLVYLLGVAKEEILKEWRKAAKHDAAVRVASVLHENGIKGVEDEFLGSEGFQEQWKLKARDVLARAEWRRRKLTKRLKDDTARVEEEEAETRENLKRQREHHKKWESSREERVGTWRDFAKKSKTGGVKPPKLKTSDEDKTYIQRATGEQFRPPSHAPPPRKG